MSLGQRILKLRGEETLQEFCNRLGNIIKPSNLSSIERDKSNPSLDVLMKISEVYGCSLDWLLKGTGQGPIVVEEKNPESEYKSKYIELLERHTKLLEDTLEKKDQRIREQSPATIPDKTTH